MISFIKFYAILSFCVIASKSIHRETILTEDWPYEVMNIKIPKEIWKQALNPTPVLKSQVTIVVPVHVPQDEENEVQDEIQDETEDEIEDEVVEEAGEDGEETLPADEPSPELPPPSQLPQVTQRPSQEDEVSGQVSRFPCSCPSGQCGCCTGAILDRLNMRACGNISFIPEDFVFDVRLSINNNTVIRRRVSASDPPPICINPRRAPFVEVCAEISNIRIRNRNAFACLDINANIADFPVYSASFRCFGLGASGLQTGLKPKPVSSGPAPVNLFGSGDDDDRGSFLENVASSALGGGGSGGLFGGGGGGGGGDAGGDSDDDDDGGPLDAIGDVVDDIFEGRKMKL